MRCKTCGHPETAHVGQGCSCQKFVVPCCDDPAAGDECRCSCHDMVSVKDRPPLPPSTEDVTYVWADELEALENEVDHLEGFINALRKRRGLPTLEESRHIEANMKFDPGPGLVDEPYTEP